jgi:hypothetical protein
MPADTILLVCFSNNMAGNITPTTNKTSSGDGDDQRSIMRERNRFKSIELLAKLRTELPDRFESMVKMWLSVYLVSGSLQLDCIITYPYLFGFSVMILCTNTPPFIIILSSSWPDGPLCFNFTICSSSPYCFSPYVLLWASDPEPAYSISRHCH